LFYCFSSFMSVFIINVLLCAFVSCL
jgi:hypothetical protein